MKLSGQAWMTDPATRTVMDALAAAGGRGCARFVGGAVRNSLMGLGVDDVDIASRLEPAAVVAALDAAGLKSVPTGIEHGTVTAIARGTPYEITTLRRDVSTDGRNATVAFTDDWTEDAMRRDFRLNALYADADGTVFDPTGGGIEDALEGRIIFVGEAETRIREDFLRILRFFRFHAWYGRGEADATALAACAALKDGMVRLSAERVQKEILKLLAARDPSPAVRLMRDTGVLAQVLPEARVLEPLKAMVAIDADPVLRLAALVEGDGAAIAQRLRLSNAQKNRLAAAIAPEPMVSGALSEKAARRILYAIGWQAFADRVKLRQAQGGPPAQPLLDRLAGWTRPILPVQGRDVLALGLDPGPGVTEALNRVEAWWIDEDFPADRALALERLKQVLR